MEIRVSKVNADTFGKTDLYIWEKASTQETIQYLKNAYDFFGKHAVKESYKVFALKVVAKYLTKAGFPKDQIALKSGKSEIILNKNGDIMIKGKKINVKGSGDVIIKGSKIKGN